MGVTIPKNPVRGRIHGRSFVMHHAELVNGELSFRNQRGNYSYGVVIDFNGATAESLVGKTLNITTGTKRAAKAALVWRENNQTLTEEFTGSYAMRLEFDRITNDSQNPGPYLNGSIYLCTPDDAKSYVAGTFKAYTDYSK
jgi:hypothetical protein